MILRRVLPVLLCILILSSCSGGGIEVGGMGELLRPPALNRRQIDVSAALQKTLNLSDIVYRYPQRGEYLSPFVFYDIDGNGRDEAIVFYAYTDSPMEARTKILQLDDAGEWRPFCDVPGQGDQIEFIEFPVVLSYNAPCMLIGWRDTVRQERQLGVYSMTDGVFTTEVLQKYDAFSVADFGGNLLSQIVLVTRENRRSPYEMQLLGERSGHLVTLNRLVLGDEVASILRMVLGKLWDGSSAAYVDEVLDNDVVATEIVRIMPGRLTCLAGGANGEESEQWDYYLQTFRPDRTLSVDIDQDDRVEIPFLVSLPATEESDEVAPLMLTRYARATPEGLVETFSCMVNEDAGYMVYFPDRWLETVTVISVPELNEWRFYRVNPSSWEVADELLRIAVVFTRDEEPIRTDGYIDLGSKGALQYRAYIPVAVRSELSISEQELRERMFAIL